MGSGVKTGMLLEQVHEVAERFQRVLDLVGDGGGVASDLGKLLGKLQRILGAALLVGLLLKGGGVRNGCGSEAGQQLQDMAGAVVECAGSRGNDDQKTDQLARSRQGHSNSGGRTHL